MILALLFSAITAHAQNFWVEAEAGPVWQGKNEAQIPSSSGTQGSRAEDVALMIGYRPSDATEFRVGYRTVEGGADGGGDVYNFAWLHYAILGLQQLF